MHDDFRSDAYQKALDYAMRAIATLPSEVRISPDEARKLLRDLRGGRLEVGQLLQDATTPPSELNDVQIHAVNAA
jgi:hypothetical protein